MRHGRLPFIVLAAALLTSNLCRAQELPKHAVLRVGSFGDTAMGNGVRRLALAPHQHLLALGDGTGRVQIYHSATGKLLNTLVGHDQAVTDLAFSPDERYLVSTSDGAQTIQWDAKNGKQSRVFDRGGRVVRFGEDGKSFIVVDATGTARFATRGGDLLRKAASTTPRIALALSSNGALLVAMKRHAKQSFSVLDSASLLELYGFSGISAPIAVADMSSRKLIATCGQDETFASIWSLKSRTAVVRLKGHTDPIEAIAFSPSGRFVATGSRDNTVRIWETATGATLAILKGHTAPIRCVAFSPNERRLASGADGASDKSAILWDLHSATAETFTGKIDEALLQRAWLYLGSASADKAYRAIAVMVAAPQASIELFAEGTAPATESASKAEIERLIRQLDSDKFTERELASQELAQLRPACDERLKRVLSTEPSIEVRLRALKLLRSPINGANLPAFERRRYLRLIYALEIIDNRQSRALLTTLSTSHPSQEVNLHAREALERAGRE